MFTDQEFPGPSLLLRLRRTAGWILQRVARFGAALVSPIELAFEFLAGHLFAVSEKAENFELLILALLRALTWPVRAFAYLVGRSLARVTPNWVVRAALVPVHGWLWFQSHTVATLVWLGEALNLDVALLFFARILRPFWYPFAAVGYFVYVLAATRSIRSLLWGLFAVVLVLPISVVLAWSALGGKGEVAARYHLAVKQAIESKDYSRAQLFERKLAQLGVFTQLSDYNTALALERQGKMAEAYERIQRLAPLEAPGYPQAHFWIISHLLSHKLDVPRDDAHRLVGIHLDHLASLEIKGPDMDFIRAYWLKQGNKFEAAALLLKPLVHLKPAAAIERLQIDLVLNKRDEARLDALEVRGHMLRLSRNDAASLTSSDYQWWAAAEEALGNKDAIRDLLRESLERDPKNEASRSSLATLSLREFDQVLFTPNPDPSELAARILDAFAAAEPPAGIKDRVSSLFQQRNNYPALRSLFDILAQTQDLSASLAETLGTAAAVNGEWDKARFFLEQAVSKDATNAVAWNNLACALLQKKNSPLDKALFASNKALELKPDDFRFRETHGEILLKLSRWQEAVKDLEYALNGLPDTPNIHQSLGTAYDALGNKELAAAHRQYAN